MIKEALDDGTEYKAASVPVLVPYVTVFAPVVVHVRVKVTVVPEEGTDGVDGENVQPLALGLKVTPLEEAGDTVIVMLPLAVLTRRELVTG